jgi:hypothetical protein
MSQERPDHHDAELVLRVYELRREPVMRESRGLMNQKFWPKDYADVQAVAKGDHPLNAAYRQVGTFWEMVYGIVKHGIVHSEYFLESNGEGLLFFAKVAPFLAEIRRDTSPVTLANTEWVSRETERGRRVFEVMTGRVKETLESL